MMDELKGFNESLSHLEQIFKVPSFTPPLLQAIKRITPQFNLDYSPDAKAFWELSQNGACWGEYLALKFFFEAFPKPDKILEIGPGMGRSLVFFNQVLGWSDCQIDAYEGDGLATNYTLQGPRFKDSWCGNIKILKEILTFNQLEHVTIYDAHQIKLTELPGPYDLIYSFYSIGFHWALEHFLDDLLSLLAPDGVGIVIIPEKFESFCALSKLNVKIIHGQNMWPKDRVLNLLLFGRSTLTDG